MLEVAGTPRATLLVTLWGQHPASAWRDAVRLGIGQSERWCFCLTGPRLRIVDSSRTYSRQFVEFDIETALENEQTFAAFWGLLRGAAMAGASRDARPLLDRAIELSEQHRASVRASLQHGVHDALGHLTRAFSAASRRRRAHWPRRGRVDPATPVSEFDEALVVVYRILFLLFAEARGLVPRWHPIYRDSYTIESLAWAGRDAARGRWASGKRCRRSRGSRIADAASARCACRRSTAVCSRPHTRRSPTACRSTIASCGRRCWR